MKFNFTVDSARECLKSVQHFGFDRVHNVCSGGATDVPWGFVGWFGLAVFVMLLILGSILIIGSILPENSKS